MFTSLMKEGSEVPSSMKPLYNAWVENTLVPLTAQNEEQKQAIIQQMRQQQAEAAEPQAQQQMEQQQGSEMPTEQQEQIQSQQPVMAA